MEAQEIADTRIWTKERRAAGRTLDQPALMEQNEQLALQIEAFNLKTNKHF